MLYFTSDQHFGHQNILRYAKRPFDDSQSGMIDCARFMYETYQQIVTDNDIVVFLGDIALVNSHNKDVFKELIHSMNGTKLMLWGNHDKMDYRYYRDCGFVDIRDFHIVRKHFICHYPCVSSGTPKERLCKNAFDNSDCTEIWHGHVHEKHPPAFDGIRRHNMCVDYAPNAFKPVLINDSELISYFRRFK